MRSSTFFLHEKQSNPANFWRWIPYVVIHGINLLKKKKKKRVKEENKKTNLREVTTEKEDKKKKGERNLGRKRLNYRESQGTFKYKKNKKYYIQLKS